METAINIGYGEKCYLDIFVFFSSSPTFAYNNCGVSDRYACSLLRQEMKQIVITLDEPDIKALERQGDKEAIDKVKDLYSIQQQLLLVLKLWTIYSFRLQFEVYKNK